VEAHFEGKDPALRSRFDALRRALERRGPLRVDAVESTINLAAVSHFGGVAVRKDHLRVGFLLDEELRADRIARAQRIGAHRVLHHVLIRTTDDIDDELLGWLEAARTLACGKSKP
jgi:hypothetical protein